MIIDITKITDNILIPLYIESNIDCNGILVDTESYVNALTYDNIILKNESIFDVNLLKEYFSKDIITGTTVSKLNNIVRESEFNFKDINLKLGKKLSIFGTDSYGLISDYTVVGSGYTSTYYLFIDTDNPIKYIDNFNNTTTFAYKANNDMVNKTVFNLFTNISQEPQITSDIFIDRGVNNVFEPIIKLGKVKSIEELKKIGEGYFKIKKGGLLI
jgi:hypothetical protein